MSNYLAIAQVTATLRSIVTNSLPPDLSSAAVTTLRPDGQWGAADALGVNIFLYRVAPNAAMRNNDLPTRSADGTLRQLPTIALDLDYLFTFYGNEAELEPQRLMGAVTTTLHAMPVLSAAEIAQALLHMPPFNASPFTSAPFLQPPYQPDLASSPERVRMTLLPLSLEELSKLWSVFYQIPYALTLAYQASVVLMQPEQMVPQTAPPVQQRVVAATVWNQAEITAIVSQAGAGEPITPGATILIQGSGLAGSGQTITLDNYATPLTPSKVSESQLVVPLPNDVPAGTRLLTLVENYQLGSPAIVHSGSTAPGASFALQPVITGKPNLASGVLTCNVQPLARQRQRVTLLLNEATRPAPTSPAAYTFALPPLPADTSALLFPITGVQGSTTYYVRIRIDGAESPLNMDSTSAGYGPLLVMP